MNALLLFMIILLFIYIKYMSLHRVYVSRKS